MCLNWLFIISKERVSLKDVELVFARKPWGIGVWFVWLSFWLLSVRLLLFYFIYLFFFTSVLELRVFGVYKALWIPLVGLGLTGMCEHTGPHTHKGLHFGLNKQRPRFHFSRFSVAAVLKFLVQFGARTCKMHFSLRTGPPHVLQLAQPPALFSMGDTQSEGL